MATVDRSAGETPIRRIPTADLTAADIERLRAMLWAAYPDGEEAFTEDDWQHALGGIHFLLERDGQVLAHASVVERDIRVGDRPLRTGYVEAVATEPARQGTGLGTRVMEAVNQEIRASFELGALGTGAFRFYERLGWQRWLGPTFVRTENGPQRTPNEDGSILVLLTPSTPPLDFTAPMSCEWRPGDVW